MLTYAKKLVATTLVSSTLVLGGLAPMAAAQDVTQDGLVNVNVGDVTILEDVNVTVAALVDVVALCDVDVGPVAVAVLGKAIAVDNSGRSRTVCTSGDDNVDIVQNVA
jgi:hypothetical protein